MTDEEEFKPNPHFRPLTAREHHKLAMELDAMQHRLVEVASDLVARYRHPADPFDRACEAAAGVEWLALALDDQFIRDEPEHADHCYTSRWPVELVWPVPPNGP